MDEEVKLQVEVNRQKEVRWEAEHMKVEEVREEAKWELCRSNGDSGCLLYVL